MSDRTNYITKGTRIRAEWMQAQTNPPASLAGMQMKFGATLHQVTGTVRHLYGDDPVNPSKAVFYVQPDEGEEGKMCETCGVREVVVASQHVVEVLP